MNGSVSGYLEIIYGPMKSGKTSRLLQLYKQFKFCEIPVMVINNCKDTRYSETCLSNHDKIMIPCIQSDKLSDLIDINNGINNGIHNGIHNGTHVLEFL